MLSPLPVLTASPCPFCSCSLSEEQHPELPSPGTALLGMPPAERYANVPSGDDVQHDASCWLLLKCKSRQGAVGLTAAAGGSEHDSRSVRRSANLLRVTALIERGKKLPESGQERPGAARDAGRARTSRWGACQEISPCLRQSSAFGTAPTCFRGILKDGVSGGKRKPECEQGALKGALHRLCCYLPPLGWLQHQLLCP